MVLEWFGSITYTFINMLLFNFKICVSVIHRNNIYLNFQKSCFSFALQLHSDFQLKICSCFALVLLSNYSGINSSIKNAIPQRVKEIQCFSKVKTNVRNRWIIGAETTLTLSIKIWILNSRWENTDGITLSLRWI